MAPHKTKRRADRRVAREGLKAATPKAKAPVADGLDRSEIERANARGPSAVAALIHGAGKAPAKATAKPGIAERAKATPFTSDPRLPKPGSTIERIYRGKTLRVTVAQDGFRHDGKTYRSLSALAREITGAASINGLLWFGLTERPKATPKRPRPAREAPATRFALDLPEAGKAAAPPKAPRGTPAQVASVAKARAARWAKIAARKAEQKK